MVVHSQPVCPPHTPSPFQFARFGTELLSFYSSMKKLFVSIICVVTYNWGKGKRNGMREGRGRYSYLGGGCDHTATKPILA